MKNLKFIIIVAVLILLVFFGINAKKYYDNRYVGTDYYTKVPNDEDMSIVDIIDSAGKKTGIKGKQYKLLSFNEKGEERILEFTVQGTDNQYPPNTYLKISASKQIVLGQQIVSTKDIPEKVLKIINERIK